MLFWEGQILVVLLFVDANYSFCFKGPLIRATNIPVWANIHPWGFNHGAYSSEFSNLPATRRSIWILFKKTFKKISWRRRQRELQYSNRLNRQNSNSARASRVHHAFLYISLPSLHGYDGKMPYFTFYGGRKRATAKFSLSFWTWTWFFGIRLKKSSLAFDKVNELD